MCSDLHIVKGRTTQLSRLRVYKLDVDISAQNLHVAEGPKVDQGVPHVHVADSLDRPIDPQRCSRGQSTQDEIEVTLDDSLFDTVEHCVQGLFGKLGVGLGEFGDCLDHVGQVRSVRVGVGQQVLDAVARLGVQVTDGFHDSY